MSRLTHHDAQLRLDAKGHCLTLLSFSGTFKISRFECRKCGNVFSKAYRYVDSAWRVGSCDRCYVNTAAIDEYRKQAKSWGWELLVPDLEYKSNVPMLHKCLTCGAERKLHKLYKPMKCFICTGKRSGSNKGEYTTKDWNAELVRKGLTFEAIGTYMGSTLPVLHRCTLCNREYDIKPSVILDYYAKRGAGCKFCYNATNHKEVSIRGQIFRVRGYEPQALEWIFSHTKIKPTSILTDEEHGIRIPFVYSGKTRYHIPDFHVKNTRILIEVKSIQSSGLGGVFYNRTPRQLWSMLRCKYRAALDLGYDYRLLLMNFDGSRIMLPEDCLDLTLTQVRKKLEYSEIIL